MSLLYEREITREPNSDTLAVMADVLHENKLTKNMDFISDVRKLFEENASNIDEIIERNCKSWSLSRLSRVDLCILRLAVIELYYLSDDPFKVIVDEALELAKKYSDEDKAPRFINGVLGSIIKEQKELKVNQ